MQDDTRCTKCGRTFMAGKVYGYACQHSPNCGPMVPTKPRLDPMPRQDVQLPPRWPEAAEAERDRLREALRELIDHTHNCERELTEELHHVDFCGESLPLTKARAALKPDAKEDI